MTELYSDDAPAGSSFFQQPHDIVAEESVLGALLLSPQARLDVIGGRLLDGDDFYVMKHQMIWDAIVALEEAGKRPDASLVASELLRRGELNRVGGLAFLHQLVAGVPAPGSAADYAREVRERGVLRRLQTAGVKVQQLATTTDGMSADVILAEAQRIVAGLSGVGRVVNVQPLSHLAADIVAGLTDDAPADGPVVQWWWPYHDLRHLLPAPRPGQLVYVAARPSVGKSTVLRDAARCFAIDQGLRVDLWTQEVPQTEVVEQLLSAIAAVPLKAIQDKTVREEHLPKLYAAVETLDRVELRIYDEPGGLPEITAAARKGNTDVVMYDHVGLIPMPQPKGGDVAQAQRVFLGEFSKGLKRLAKAEECLVFAAAQLNRGPEQRKDKKPELGDLRNSGDLEQDADIVLLLHREDAYEPESPRAGEADIIVAKDRNGPKGTVTVAAQLHYGRFRDLAGHWQQEPPR